MAVFRWKEDANSEAVSHALGAIQNLATIIPGITDIHIGKINKTYPNGTPRFECGVVILCQNQQAMDAYRKHPTHKDAASVIEQSYAEGLGVDFITT